MNVVMVKLADEDKLLALVEVTDVLKQMPISYTADGLPYLGTPGNMFSPAVKDVDELNEFCALNVERYRAYAEDKASAQALQECRTYNNYRRLPPIRPFWAEPGGR